MDDVIVRMYEICKERNPDFPVVQSYVDRLDLDSVRALAAIGCDHMLQFYKYTFSAVTKVLMRSVNEKQN